MTSVRNLSMAALTFLTLLLFGFVGCQKEPTVQLPKPQELQAELRANYCDGEIRDVAVWFSKAPANVWFPAPTATKAEPTIKTGTNGTIAFQRIGISTNYRIDFTRGVTASASDDLKDAIGSASTGKDAHHIIAWNLRENAFVQRAARAGFHPNDVVNGIALLSYIDGTGKKYKFHANAPSYDNYVAAILTRYNNSTKYSTPDAAYKFLACGLIPYLWELLKDAEATQIQVYTDYRDNGYRGATPTTLGMQYCKWHYIGDGLSACPGIATLPIEIPNWSL